MKTIFYLVLGILSILLVSGCLSAGFLAQNSCSVVEESFEECKTVEVPYQEEVCETVPIIEEKCVSKELLYESNIDRNASCIETRTRCLKFIQSGCGYGRCMEWERKCIRYMETTTVELMNLDTERGTWKFNWMRECKNQLNCNITAPDVYQMKTVSLDPREVKRFTEQIEYDAKAQEKLYMEFIKLPEKKICSNVTSTRESCVNVTLNRTEERCETKYKPVEICE